MWGGARNSSRGGQGPRKGSSVGTFKLTSKKKAPGGLTPPLDSPLL